MNSVLHILVSIFLRKSLSFQKYNKYYYITFILLLLFYMIILFYIIIIQDESF